MLTKPASSSTDAPRPRKPKAKILLLDDDPDLQELVVDYYRPRGYELICHSDPTQPLKELQGGKAPNYDLILTDLRMPRMDGLDFIRTVRKSAAGVPIILMTAHSSLEVALKAVEAGAYDYVVKPLHFPQLNFSIERALHLRKLQEENRALRTAVRTGWAFEGMIGKSLALQRIFDLVKRVANSTASVLITGDSGTGKEVVARAIHNQGNRKKGPFVAINCSAIPENLLESELFGFAKGAFTGAIDRKLGLFEEAEGGTLFLDEIGDLNLPLQAKLLRVIQERKIKRLGENQLRAINVRILAATHKDLMVEVREKRFREDLFFRLNVIPIKIPALRERAEDILPLAEHFFRKFAAQNETRAMGLSKAAVERLYRLPWRGNVRELENAIERAVVLCDQPEIGPEDLPMLEEEAAPAFGPRPVGGPGKLRRLAQPETLLSLDEFVLEYIDHVMKSVGGVKEQAARILEIDRKTLYRRLAELEERAYSSAHSVLPAPPPPDSLQ